MTMHSKSIIKREVYTKAYDTLFQAKEKTEEKISSEDFEYFRDSVIQRFEYTIEAWWKLLKTILENEDGIDLMPSPKNILKEAYKQKYISNLPMYFTMIDSRNKLSHEYGIFIAQEIYPDILHYVALLTSDRNTLQARFAWVDTDTSIQ